MVYALKSRLRTNEVIVPAVSWATTVAPLIQFGLHPILVECDRDTLGIDVEHLKQLVNDPELKPSGIILTHILGFPNKIDEILAICKENDIIPIEDSCETVGSTYNGKKTGTFGLMSSFSFYFGHHMSTIEGGMICTDDTELYYELLMLRSHGWDRDLPEEKQKELRSKNNIGEFKSRYTFYLPAFNVRATDLQAYIGLGQMKKIDDICSARQDNYNLFNELIKNDYWKPAPVGEFISNFAYPIIHPRCSEISNALTFAGVENRPLVCGSMQNQPFMKAQNYYIKKSGDSFANDVVDKHGMYIPNHHLLTHDDIYLISSIINRFTGSV
jgi:CDP-6-deoxy-D-xylo-4-hexulose-3-dehydrase